VTDDRPTPAEEAAETTRLRKIAFLAAFANCGRITKAAAGASINPDTHYEWRKSDPEYDKAFAALRERVTDLLEDEAFRRAVEGVEEPLIGRIGKDQDGVVHHAVRYSDTLLAILLKGNRPDIYRERHELTGKDGGPIETHELTESERAAGIAAIFDAARARATGSAPQGEDEVGTTAGGTDPRGEH